MIIKKSSRFILIVLSAMLAITSFSCRKVVPLEPTPPEGMVLVKSSGQSFIMGSLAGNDDEKPVRTVSFTYDYYIDSTEVTQNEYESVMGINPSGFSGEPDNPAELMTWFDAVLYCNALSRIMDLDTVYSFSGIEGTPGNDCTNLKNLSIDINRNGYRLPTEAEWEYACRAGTPTEYFWGDSTDSNYCWYDANSKKTTHPVLSLYPNAFSLFDMSGNVWEWCNDWYSLYDSTKTVDLCGPAIGAERVLRGGSWMSFENSHRSANRNSGLPLYRSKDLGFRTVLPVLK